MVRVRKISSCETALISPLAELMQDAVDGGASVGFLTPLKLDASLRYWERVLQSVGNELFLWVAEIDGRVIGSVQLELCGKENGRHRAEVQKLFVLQSHRGQGVSSMLLAAVEQFAVALDRTLLVLDTEADSKAEAVYRHLGWQPAGRIPNYAASPNGVLHATAYFYKNIPSS